MNAKIQKLEEQNLAVSLDSQIFRGITIYVNGYTSNANEILLWILNFKLNGRCLSRANI